MKEKVDSGVEGGGRVEPLGELSPLLHNCVGSIGNQEDAGKETLLEHGKQPGGKTGDTETGRESPTV